jgi:hypothetical protein
MASPNLNLTGKWSGEFAYPAHAGPETPFLACLMDLNGHVSGSIIEPDIVDGGVIEASLVGARGGSSVDFTKTYPASASPDYAEPVDYVGTLSSDGTVISGVWSLLEWDGTFEMRREPNPGESVAAQESAHVKEPVRQTR